MSSTYFAGPAWNFAPEYQASGTPFVTSSADGEVTTSGVQVWGLVDDSQSITWSAVDDSQSVTWKEAA